MQIAADPVTLELTDQAGSSLGTLDDAIRTYLPPRAEDGTEWREHEFTSDTFMLTPWDPIGRIKLTRIKVEIGKRSANRVVTAVRRADIHSRDWASTTRSVDQAGRALA